MPRLGTARRALPLRSSDSEQVSRIVATTRQSSAAQRYVQTTLRYASLSAVGFTRGTSPLARMHERCGDRGGAPTMAVSESELEERGSGGTAVKTAAAAFGLQNFEREGELWAFAGSRKACFAVCALAVEENKKKQVRRAARHRRDAIRYE